MVMDGRSNGPIQWLTHTHKHMIDGADGSRFCCDSTGKYLFSEKRQSKKEEKEEEEQQPLPSSSPAEPDIGS